MSYMIDSSMINVGDHQTTTTINQRANRPNNRIKKCYSNVTDSQNLYIPRTIEESTSVPVEGTSGPTCIQKSSSVFYMPKSLSGETRNQDGQMMSCINEESQKVSVKLEYSQAKNKPLNNNEDIKDIIDDRQYSTYSPIQEAYILTGLPSGTLQRVGSEKKS